MASYLNKKNDEILGLLGPIVENLSVGFIVLSLTGRILIINRALLKIGGFTEKELLGKNAMKLARIFPPKSIARISRSFMDALKGVPSDHYRLLAKDKNGNRHILELDTSLIKKDGKKVAVAVVIRDVTEEAEAQNKFKEKTKEVERTNRLMIGRELRMAQLKKKIKELEGRLREKGK